MTIGTVSLSLVKDVFQVLGISENEGVIFSKAIKPAKLLRKFGHNLPTGIEAVSKFTNRHLEGDRPEMPELARSVLGTQRYQSLS